MIIIGEYWKNTAIEALAFEWDWIVIFENKFKIPKFAPGYCYFSINFFFHLILKGYRVLCFLLWFFRSTNKFCPYWQAFNKDVIGKICVYIDAISNSSGKIVTWRNSIPILYYSYFITLSSSNTDTSKKWKFVHQYLKRK